MAPGSSSKVLAPSTIVCFLLLNEKHTANTISIMIMIITVIIVVIITLLL